MMPGQAAIPNTRFMAEPAPTGESSATDRDAELMVRVARGDEAAFTELVERHQHAVVGTVAKMLGDPSEAEDLAQQVFLRVWKSARRYRPTAKFTTYLFTITRHLVFNECRRRGRRREVSIEEREAAGCIQPGDVHGSRPDEELLGEELRRAIDAAIASLPENQRLAVVMRRYQETPYETIAAVLGTSVPAVKSLLFRARESLRQQLARYLDESA
jgi:RNA polymerase sigma-70 factor (ECF subfamily)